LAQHLLHEDADLVTAGEGEDVCLVGLVQGAEQVVSDGQYIWLDALEQRQEVGALSRSGVAGVSGPLLGELVRGAHSQGPDHSVAPELLHGLYGFVQVAVVGAEVTGVEKVQVEVVRAEVAKGCLELPPDLRRGVGMGRRASEVADLARHRQSAPVDLPQQTADQALRLPHPVHVCGVVQGYAEVVSAYQASERHFFIDAGPADGHAAVGG
jgi:hypothetical protein